MKVVFLDFNGVLDTWDNMNIVNQDNLRRLKRIIEATGAKVVISSSVKNTYYFLGTHSTIFKYLAKTITEAEIEIVGITPLASGKENEIKMYLESHPEVEAFCILDDEGDFLEFKENFVKLPLQSQESPDGLSDEHVNQAISILNKKEYLNTPVLKKTPIKKNGE